MGAGSSEHPLGDKAPYVEGIVQGHAYSVLDVIDLGDGEKVVKIRNPWGDKSAEWTGDWSDNSDLWDQRSMNKCNFTHKADGIFWMGIEDFVSAFKYLYICRILEGKYEKTIIQGKWNKESAEGLPSREHRNPVLKNNPQWQLKFSGPGTCFIKMT